MATAQDQGLQVVLLGIPPKWDPANQAAPLIRESDEHIVLGQDFWDPFFDHPKPPQALLEVQPSTPMTLGAAFARTWAEKSAPEDVAKLLDRAPRIPIELDVQMIVEAEQLLGSLRGNDAAKRELRKGFWNEIRNRSVDASTITETGVTEGLEP